MREILFRGKAENGEWIYGDLVHWWGRHNTKPDIQIYNNVQRFKVIPETVGQYTGLTDKNGKKIFEGDIVYSPYEDENTVIEWDDDDAMFTIVYDDICTDFSHYWGRYLEVIGNIHDNPELIGSRW